MTKDLGVGKAIASARITVDGRPLPMNDFVHAMVGHIVLGMLAALKGVRRPRKIEVQVKLG